MASHFEAAQWAVMILVERDPSLDKMYQLSSKTSLANLMRTWCDEFGLCGNWIFVSDDGKNLFDNDEMTLEMIGESKPNTKIVNLRAELSSEAKPKPVSEIFVHKSDECQYLDVNPQQTLYEVTRRPPRWSTTFEHNDVILRPQESLEQAGIKDKAFIHECRRPITVKLSTGYTTIIQLPSYSPVRQLIERVWFYETEDFSLQHHGRYLSPNETVKKLRQVVEVKREEFVVHIDEQCVRWTSRSEPILFPEFISKLSIKGQLEMQKLQSMKFYCVGCQRGICQSETDLQLLPIQCCKQKSLTLIAKSISNSDAHSKTHATSQFIENLYEHLVRHKAMDSIIGTAHDKCRNMKEEMLEKGLDYNAIIRSSEGYRRDTQKLAEKIKTLENALETMKDNNKRLIDDNDKLHQQNTELKEEYNKLHRKNNELYQKSNKLHEENDKLHEENNKLHEENNKLHEENNKLHEENKRLQEENIMLNDENIMLDEENNKLNDENNKLKGKNTKFKDQNEKLKDKNKELMNENEELKNANNETKEVAAAATALPIPKALTETITVKLAILFDPSHFVATQPDRAVQLGYHSCIKVEIPRLKPGWRRFKEVKLSLSPVFSLGWRFYVDIQDILQLRGNLIGQDVAEVTSCETDEFKTELEQKEFCSEDGQMLSWEAAGRPRRKNRCFAGDRVFICGGGRRTVLQISHL